MFCFSFFPQLMYGMWFDILQARIKAINTFFAKNGYRVVDSSVYTQPVQTQAQFASPLFMQPVYSPQQYSIYSIVPQTWSPNPAPYFETPLVSNSWWKWEELAQNIKNSLVKKSVGLVRFSSVECTGFLGSPSVLWYFLLRHGPDKARLSERLHALWLTAIYFKKYDVKFCYPVSSVTERAL